ncbi:glycosyltransferase family 87 protein [Limibacillus halophilus]
MLETGLLVAALELGLFFLYKALTRDFQDLLNSDIAAIHGALRLVFDGQAGLAELYDPERFHTLLAVTRPLDQDAFFYRWLYPPSSVLLLSPLSLAPLSASYHLLLAVTLGAAAASCWMLGARGLHWIALSLSPIVGLTCWSGQIDVLPLFFIALFLALSDRRPFLAGFLLSFALVKPQLAVLMGLALLAGGRWSELAGMLVSLALFLAISVFAFGIGAWAAFFASARDLLALLHEHFFNWSVIASPYSFFRSLGLEREAAELLQYAIALLASGAIVYSQIKGRDTRNQTWILVCAILLFSPYQWDYGLLLLLLPLSLEYAERLPLNWERVVALLIVLGAPLLRFQELALPMTPVPPLLFAILASKVLGSATRGRSGEPGAASGGP